MLVYLAHSTMLHRTSLQLFLPTILVSCGLPFPTDHSAIASQPQPILWPPPSPIARHRYSAIIWCPTVPPYRSQNLQRILDCPERRRPRPRDLPTNQHAPERLRESTTSPDLFKAFNQARAKSAGNNWGPHSLPPAKSHQPLDPGPIRNDNETHDESIRSWSHSYCNLRHCHSLQNRQMLSQVLNRFKTRARAACASNSVTVRFPSAHGGTPLTVGEVEQVFLDIIHQAGLHVDNEALLQLINGLQDNCTPLHVSHEFASDYANVSEIHLRLPLSGQQTFNRHHNPPLHGRFSTELGSFFPTTDT